MFWQAVLSIFAMEPGFETRQVVAVPIQFPESYSAGDAEALLTRFQDRVATSSQVDDVATSSTTPLAGDTEGGTASTEFRLPNQVSTEGHRATVMAVSRKYFSTLGIPFARGRGFPGSNSDDAVIISRAFAEAFWPRQDPFGQTIISGDGKHFSVIGVVPDNHTSYTSEADGPTLYTLRNKASIGDLLLVRFHGNAVPVTAMVKSIVHDLDSQMLVVPSTLRAEIDENAEHGWLIGKMLLFGAGTAVTLALLGIYGMVGYSVTRRTREFGIRVAVGATPRDVVRAVFASGSRPVIGGIIVGTAVAFGFSCAVVKALERAPIPLSSTNPVTYGMVALFLTSAALGAMIGHARRAARIEPLIALREE